MEPHIRIINEAAKKFLKPEGVFRVGSSRSWLEDNGWFLTVVEFQPSSYSKGSYLNTAVSFLWEKTSSLREGLTSDFGGRVTVNGSDFAEYRERYSKRDEQFTAEMEEFAAAALEKVKEYRRFSDMDYAKKMLIKNTECIPLRFQFWESYDLAMLCFFKGDYDDGKAYFDAFLDRLKELFYIDGLYVEWHEDFYNYCMSELVPQTVNAQSAQRMVSDMINRRRAYFTAKPSYKKIKKDILL